jgi:RNA polymerase sigma-70 factor, ECF subfamily
MELKELYSTYYPLLFSIAYRMLGTVSDAEDIVQDVYLQVSEKNFTHIENIKAYLCKSVTNRCLDYLKSAQRKRMVYIGPWLPEPFISQEENPEMEVEKEEVVSYAVLLLLEKLKPVERAIFVLREVLEYEYAAIAEIVGKSESNCRKILSRVKDKFPLENHIENTQLISHNESVIQTFISAIYNGDLQQLESLLATDVTLYSDGGGKVFAAIIPIKTRTMVFRFITHLYQQFQLLKEDSSAIKMVTINGQTGVVARVLSGVTSVFAFNVQNSHIKDIYIIRNPDKLKHLPLS